jgi:XTP/dITP diphosphohydrolase
MGDVLEKEADKLVFRHPHIYGDKTAANSDEVSKIWEQVKQKEKDGNKTVLSGVPKSLPSLIKAYRIQDKARNVGFDWEEKEDVWEKVFEEVGELKAEFEIEEGADRWYINDPCDDYYEDINIVEKVIVIR